MEHKHEWVFVEKKNGNYIYQCKHCDWKLVVGKNGEQWFE